MKWFANPRGVCLITLILSFLYVPLTWAVQVACPDVSGRNYINVLTLNLLFSEIENRDLRLTRIADFVNQETESGNPIDVILLQEVVGGALAQTNNSSIDLLSLLARRSLHYNLRYKMVNGVSGFLSVGDAILTRCAVKSALAITLPAESEEVFDGVHIALKRNVLMARIDVPGFGSIDIYDTHLCSGCSASDRFQQTLVLMRIVKVVEMRMPGNNSIILGGDFNTDLNIPDNVPLYNLITGNGFVDTYAVFNHCTSCCTPHDLSGCTFAVPGDPFATDLITGASEQPARIDYMFIKGLGPVLESEVVLKGDPLWVSDHSGVLSKISFR